jgi:hypothetical protein
VRELLHDLWAVKLSLGAVVRQEQAESAALAPVVEEARSVVQQAAVVNIDETGWRPEQARAWLWTVVTATITVFRIDRRRSGAAVEALLGADLAGVVGSDRWWAYNQFPDKRRALCWAHLKRAFQAVVDRVVKRNRSGAGDWPRSNGCLGCGTCDQDGRRPHRRQTVERAAEKYYYGGTPSPTRVAL